MAADPGNTNKRLTTTEPVTEKSQVLTFWDRELAPEGYRGLFVEVVGRKDNVISFKVLDADGNASVTVYSVNLDDGLEAWGSLPSTAQEVDVQSSQRVGYLFVSTPYLERNSLAPAEPPKWPRHLSI